MNEPGDLCRRCKERFARTRGQCQRCYDLTRAEVERGITTWEEQYQVGTASPPRTRQQQREAAGKFWRWLKARPKTE